MRVPLFPLNTVLFPGAVLPLHIFEDRYKALVKYCLSEQVPFGVALIREGREVGGPSVPRSVGTLARIVQAEELQDGRFNIVCRGEDRFRVTAVDRRAAEYLVADLEPFPDESAPPPALAMVAQRVSMLFNEYYRLVVALMGGWQRATTPDEHIFMFDAGTLAEKQAQLQQERLMDGEETPVMRMPALAEDPAELANTVASELNVHVNVKQDLLEAPSALLRLQKEAEVLTEETSSLAERLRLQFRRRFTAFGTSN